MDHTQLPTYTVTDNAPSSSRRQILRDLQDPAPLYGREDIWSQWEIADMAIKVVNDSSVSLARIEDELQVELKESTKLKERSTKEFESAHKDQKLKIRLPSIKRGSRSPSTSPNNPEGSSLQRFETAYRDETNVEMKIVNLKTKIQRLKDTINTKTQLANSANEIFEKLGAFVEGLLPPEQIHTRVEERLAVAQSEYDQKQELVADLIRARQTVQHAHHYYGVALRAMDKARSTTFGRVVLGGMEMSKQEGFVVAEDTENKAHVCFLDTVRVLTPHVEMIPGDIRGDFEMLKELGLNQASRIYELMFNPKARSANKDNNLLPPGEEIEHLMKVQEDNFARLTRLAVLVQDKVPVCENELRNARISRDELRRNLVLYWYQRQRAFIDNLGTL